MAADPYKTLGVAKGATADQIRKAYRKLAKKYHPDLNPGNKAYEELFKAAASANDLLSDPDKRARYDRGEIDGAGDPKPEPPRYQRYADDRPGRRYSQSAGGSPFGQGEGMGDIFSEFFTRNAGGAAMPMRGHDVNYTLSVSFLDAVQGATPRLALPEGRSLDVRIPPGIEDGQTMRLKGQGGPGANGGAAGDALIEITVQPHGFFRRDGNDILVDLPVTLKEAVLGARITVPTPSGPVAMTIPKRSDTGTRLRLRGRGIPEHGSRPAGDEYITLRVTTVGADDALAAFLEGWSPENAADPRRDMVGAGDMP
jgi:DnaJ-class molecular chaperone